MQLTDTFAVDCLERFVSKMTHYMSSGTVNPARSLTHSRGDGFSAWNALPDDICALSDFADFSKRMN